MCSRWGDDPSRRTASRGTPLRPSRCNKCSRALAVSPRPVETHRANLFSKLEAESLAQVIRQYADLAEGGGRPPGA